MAKKHLELAHLLARERRLAGRQREEDTQVHLTLPGTPSECEGAGVGSWAGVFHSWEFIGGKTSGGLLVTWTAMGFIAKQIYRE